MHTASEAARHEAVPEADGHRIAGTRAKTRCTARCRRTPVDHRAQSNPPFSHGLSTGRDECAERRAANALHTV
eukprot:6172559-Prymnesium_polylepis.2